MFVNLKVFVNFKRNAFIKKKVQRKLIDVHYKMEYIFQREHYHTNSYNNVLKCLIMD